MLFDRKKARTYLDYASTTPVCKEARDAMNEVLDTYGNPGALHTEGLEAASVRDGAHASIAKHLGVKATEIIFVSGGTEGNNLVLLGFLNELEKGGADISKLHMITSSIEHSSVLETCKELERRGVGVTYVSSDERGIIRPEVVEDALQENTVLVSIGLVNGEIGTVQPLHAISKAIKAHAPDVKIHTDACQGMYVSLVSQGLGVDLMTLDSTKMYGPRGVGVVYVKRNTKLSPILFGGGQEGGLRSGTENTVLYGGFAAAFNRAVGTRKDESKRLEALRLDFLKEVQENIPEVIVNGTGKQQSPHVVNISVPNIDAEYTTLYLDARGVAISTKSACKESEGEDASHVVEQLGENPSPPAGGGGWRAKNTLRFSFGAETTEKDITRASALLKEAVEKQREFS